MMQVGTFIQDLAVIMLIAGIITVLCHRFKQPVVLGYIIAGVIIGPHTPPFAYIQNEEIIKTLAEVGVIFLMFSLGLEFNLPKLKKVGFASFIAALLEILLMMWVGYEIGLLFKWSPIDALFLGAILAISSTTIIMKALEDLGIKRERFAQLIFGILIIEDIFAIAILALLSSIAVTGSLHTKDVFIALAQLSSFLVISLILGILSIPKLLAYIAKFNNEEMLLISVLGLCFGFCLLTLKFDYSIALGAFVIGAIIAESRQIKMIETLIVPLRNMFSAIFFVSVGLLFDPKVLVEYSIPIIIITIAVVIGKVLTCSLGMLVTGRDGRTAMRVGMGLAQIGEFSFIIASLGMSLKVTSRFLYPIAVAVSAITTLLTPYLIKYSDSFSQYIAKIIPDKISVVFEYYTKWLQSINLGEERAEITKIVRRSFFQVVINLIIVMAIFFFSEYVGTKGWGTFLIQYMGIYLQKTLIWGSALILSLPFLIAVYRKIKALSMILAELSVKKSANKQFTIKVRRLISEVIPILSLIGIIIFISVLSSNILPPFGLLIFILVIILGLVALLFPWFIKFHSKLQVSLLEAMNHHQESK